jgi:hypothetical protein
MCLVIVFLVFVISSVVLLVDVTVHVNLYDVIFTVIAPVSSRVYVL